MKHKRHRKKKLTSKKLEKLTAKYYNSQAVGLVAGKCPSHAGYRRPRKQYIDRCNVCEGTGQMRGIHGFEPCSRCAARD